MNLTETRADVLLLIADGRSIADYVPRYKPGARRGFGAFPVTIAERAAEDLLRAGLVERGEKGLRLTDKGKDVVATLRTPMMERDGKPYCKFCGTGTDEPLREQGLPFCHTQDCDWLVANVKPVKGWRATPGASLRPSMRR